jgi:hypothetical protein
MTVKELYEQAAVLTMDHQDEPTYVLFDSCFYRVQTLSMEKDEFGNICCIRVDYDNPR